MTTLSRGMSMRQIKNTNQTARVVRSGKEVRMNPLIFTNILKAKTMMRLVHLQDQRPLEKGMSSARRYHYQTRQITRLTRSAYKRYKSNNIKSGSVKTLQSSKRLVRKTRDPLSGLTPSYASINSATIKGSIERRGIPPERLMKAWKIDRDTAVRTIRAKSQR